MTTLGAVVALLATVAGIVAVVMNRRYDAAAKRAADREAAREELRKAVAEGRRFDAVMWARRLRELGGVVLVLLLGLAAGCATTDGKTPQPLVLGDRWILVKPGEVVTVPPLQPPAKQWHMIDDVGLSAGLGILTPTGK